MKEKKVRQKGFFALLLATVIVLGMPGKSVLAATYEYFQLPAVIQPGDRIVCPIYTSGQNTVLDSYLYIDNNSTHIANAHSNSQNVNAYAVIPSGYWTVNNFTFSYDNGDQILTINVSATSAPASSNSSSGGSPAEGYYRSLKALIAAINIEGGDTHGYGIGTALPYSVMKTLEDNPEDTLVFTCEYKNYRYTFTILGADVKGKISPEIPWYGPYWLAQNFFETTEIECLIPETEAK